MSTVTNEECYWQSDVSYYENFFFFFFFADSTDKGMSVVASEFIISAVIVCFLSYVNILQMR